MLLTASGSGDKELHPEGMFPAVCVLIAGIGTQSTPFKNEDGTDKVQKKIVFGFETEHGVISKEYTMSLNEKANLRAVLKSWRGKDLTAEEQEGFDPTVLLGTQCTVQVMHNEKGSFANVNTVLPKTGAFKATKPAVQYDIDEHTTESYEKLPNWVQKKVIESYEWDRIRTGQAFDDPGPSDADAPIDAGDYEQLI